MVHVKHYKTLYKFVKVMQSALYSAYSITQTNFYTLHVHIMHMKTTY